jgi:hypothetical protein
MNLNIQAVGTAVSWLPPCRTFGVLDKKKDFMQILCNRLSKFYSNFPASCVNEMTKDAVKRTKKMLTSLKYKK